MIHNLGWRYIWPIQAWLFRNRKEFDADGLLTIENDGETASLFVERPVPALQVLIDQAKTEAEQGFKLIASRIHFQQIDPSHSTAWTTLLPRGSRIDVRVGIVCNPGCRLYSGGAAWVMTEGATVAIETHVPHSAVNFGQKPWIDLVFQLAKAND